MESIYPNTKKVNNSPHQIPRRVHRKRTKGWRMPDAVYVGRPTKWGNPFTLIEHSVSHTRDGIVQLYAEALDRNDTDWSRWINANISQLRGKNLACWCRLDQVCHADVLLRLANDTSNTHRILSYPRASKETG